MGAELGADPNDAPHFLIRQLDRDIAATPKCEGLNALRLVLDIDRSADGRVEGSAHPVGAPAAMPFSGWLELLGTLEELLLPKEGS